MARGTSSIPILIMALMQVGCVDRLDASRPIALVPQAGWSAEQVQQIRDAAQSWNLEVGTDLFVERDRPQSRTDQRVPIRRSDLVCSYTNGITVFVGDPEIQICTLDAASPPRFRDVTLHEIGHVLNIREHAADPLAVMSAESREGKRFRTEDRQLFEEANPGFEERGACDVARKLGQSPSRPVLVQAASGQTFAFWAELALWGEQDLLRFTELDFSSAKPRGLSGAIKTSGYARWIRALPSAGGFTLTWVQEEALYRSFVHLPSGRVEQPVRLGVSVKEVGNVSTASMGSDLFVAITAGDLLADLHTYRFDTTTGEPKPLQLPHPQQGWGYLATSARDLFLVLADQQGVRVERRDPSGQLLEVLQVEEWVGQTSHDSFHAQVVDDAILIVSRNGHEQLQIHRVGFADKLILEKTSVLEPPGNIGHTLFSVAGTSCGIALAISHFDRSVEEVLVTVLDPRSLGVKRPWWRLSSPDLTRSIQPWLAARHCQFLALWRDVHDPLEVEVRSRCF